MKVIFLSLFVAFFSPGAWGQSPSSAGKDAKMEKIKACEDAIHRKLTLQRQSCFFLARQENHLTPEKIRACGKRDTAEQIGACISAAASAPPPAIPPAKTLRPSVPAVPPGQKGPSGDAKYPLG